MSSTSSTLVYAELLSNIRQVSIIASFQTPSTTATKAELADNRELLKLVHNGFTAHLRLPAQVAAVPKLQQPLPGSKEISWRLPLGNPDKAKTAADSENTACAPWSAKGLSDHSEFRCRMCLNSLLASGKVKSWKDLPSENWAEMMDFWHCHKPDVPKEHNNGHSHEHLKHKGYGANTRFVARKGVAFVDLTYFLLSEEDCRGVELDQVWKQPSTSLAFHQPLLCLKCKATVGAVDTLSDGFRLYKWALCVSEPSSQQPTDYPLAHFLSAQLLSQISSQAVNKFILHSTESLGSSPSILYIWVFAPYLTISFSSPEAGSRKPIPASKVFYRSVTATEGTNIIEKASMSTEEVRLPTESLTEVSRILDESNKKMPQSARKFREWDVGFLERFTEREQVIELL